MLFSGSGSEPTRSGSNRSRHCCPSEPLSLGKACLGARFRGHDSQRRPRAALAPPRRRGPWLDADHPALRVSRKHAFGLIEEGQFVAERVADARASADRDVERTLDGLAARAHEERERVIDILNQNIGFRTNMQVSYELGVGVRKGEPDRVFAPPEHPMPEAIAIERDSRIKVGDAKRKVVELPKQRLGVHSKLSPLGRSRRPVAAPPLNRSRAFSGIEGSPYAGSAPGANPSPR